MFYLSDYRNIDHMQENIHESSMRNNLRKNDVKAKNRKKEYISLKFLCELLDEYCEFGSLHGLRYIRNSSLPRVERLFWLGIFLTCLYVSGVVVWDAYLAGISNELQLVLDPRSTPIWDIPFPAVLVCSAYPIRKSVFDLDKQVDNVKFRHFSKIVCLNNVGFKSEEFNGTIDEEFFDFISNAAIPCRDLIVNCYWHNMKRDCCSIFTPIITEFGLCYVFNSLPGETLMKYYKPPPGVEVENDDSLMFWDIEKGYPKQERRGTRVRPYWVKSGGPLTGITFDLVDIRQEWQQKCSGPYSGFRLYIYPPDGHFETETYMNIPYNVHTYIKLKPYFITAEENLRSVDVDERQCVFKDEMKLEYYNDYSMSACRVECFTKTAINLCGCAPFTSHRMVSAFGYPYCNDSSTSCLMTVYDNLTASSMTVRKIKLGSQAECSCAPGCFWMTYDFQNSIQKVSDIGTTYPWSKSYNKTTVDNIARLSIYYSVQQFNAIKRVKASDLGAALANCGGLLGLLLGYSFMSLFEVFYFAIIRPIRHILT